MKKTDKCCVLIAGETSGDLIGKEIAHTLKANVPDLRMYGVAGPCMREEGVLPWIQAESFQVMGLIDVLKKGFSLYRWVQFLKNKILKTNPEIVFCIDQPSLSIMLAKKLRKSGFTGKLVQVVAPSVWAYKEKRADIFASLFDLILPLFHFECSFFEKKMKTVWVGHPIVDVVREHTSIVPKRYLALFPGSRKSEIMNNLPLQLKAAQIVVEEYKDLIPAVVVPNMAHVSVRNYVMSSLLSYFPQGEIFSFEERYKLMQGSKAAITKSGTVTLELALFDVPFVCCYETNFLTRLWLRWICGLRFNKDSFFSLPNILMKKKLFPERIIPPVTPALVAHDLLPFLRGKAHIPPSAREKIVENIDKKMPFGAAVFDAVQSSFEGLL